MPTGPVHGQHPTPVVSHGHHPLVHAEPVEQAVEQAVEVAPVLGGDVLVRQRGTRFDVLIRWRVSIRRTAPDSDRIDSECVVARSAE